MSQKSSEVNELQMKWIQNEEKRRKRIYDETKPVIADSITQEHKRQTTTKALVSNEQEEPSMAASSTRPTKKQSKEEQNEFAIGGIRNPAIAASRLPQVRRVGMEINRAWKDFVTENPAALKIAEDYGLDAKFDEDLLAEWTRTLGNLLGYSESKKKKKKESPSRTKRSSSHR